MRDRPRAKLRPQRGRLARALVLLLVCMVLVPVTFKPAAAADPLLTVTKDTLLGAVTGLVLGGTLTLVIEDSGKQSETVRWGVVIGTFGGFIFGVYHATRGDQSLFADAEGDPGSLSRKIHLPAASRCAGPAPREFPSQRYDPVGVACSGGWSMRCSLLQMSW